MAHRTRMILAWDRSYFQQEDIALLHMLAPHFDYIKVGYEALTAEDRGYGRTVAVKIRNHSPKPCMWDIKLHDINNTMSRAIRNIAEHSEKIKMLTLHASASLNALKSAAIICQENGILPLAVTVLSDIDEEECDDRFDQSPSELVLRRVQEVRKCGIRGLVCSAHELPYLRENGALDGMVSLVTGIRPAGSAAHDQKRIMTPGEAQEAGADYIIIGRPVLEATDPVLAAIAIQHELDARAS